MGLSIGNYKEGKIQQKSTSYESYLEQMNENNSIPENYLKTPYGNVEYIKYGSGEKLLICLHGFGDKAQLYQVLKSSLSEKYTVYAISLPYHGKTRWNRKFFSKNDLIKLFLAISKMEKKKSFSLMGYSMGGRISLSLIQRILPRLEEVYLLAPDGVKTHPLYDINALPRVLIILLKALMRLPWLFFKIVDFVYEKNWISKFLYDFTCNHFGHKSQRQRFFNMHKTMRAFKPDLIGIKKGLNEYKIPVHLFYGRRDEVVLLEGAHILSEGIQNCTIDILDKGHLLVDEDLNPIMKKYTY
ncbi:alpha/beta fold hydrolase [Sediminitomix flava]|uniref:Pimeloyl-ACP methyl ester carboxylesterase n=1 Tax=Sediminitomix flava TaxID=379075 RepID=A0A315YXY3_SEDFL|nr:alpha/beta hydrolase [Sediminitomix flava]PWJ34162.1 pimeloyl-ACP methyl ester carboxylesterase [Sediminitomix flava]